MRLDGENYGEKFLDNNNNNNNNELSYRSPLGKIQTDLSATWQSF